jgi:hypothetical protein
MPHQGGVQQKFPASLWRTHMSENTPKSKEEMERDLKDLQIAPEDLDAVVGGVAAVCSTCYTTYTSDPPPVTPPTPIECEC